MGRYELVRSDDAPAVAADLEAGTAAPCDGYPKRRVFTPSPSPSPAPASTRYRQRLVSLDVFRGITVLLMIIVDDAGAFIPAMNHSPWDGVTVADFVMPFFLFIVGVALALAYKRVPDKLDASRKALLRALKLFCLGLVLQGGFFHGVRSLSFGVDLQEIRLMGVLQRIAIAYLLTALCEIWIRGDEDVDYGYDLLKRYRYQLFVGAVVAITYMSLLYGTYVPDWEYQTSAPGSTEKHLFVKCGVRGDTSPGCNAVGMIDRKILGIQHLYGRPVYARSKQCSIDSPQNGPLPSDAPSWCQAPFDPEGLLSSVMAIVTCLIGLQYGHVIVHFQGEDDELANPFLQHAGPSLRHGLLWTTHEQATVHPELHLRHRRRGGAPLLRNLHAGRHLRVPAADRRHGMDGDARADDIRPDRLQRPAHIHPRLLLEGAQEQPAEVHRDWSVRRWTDDGTRVRILFRSLFGQR
uniref:Heparan-alpha-glucosaminide N-acetyltransferase catalytic domain-containing protein n=1 Tax=Zea mays TaxID=4577 RepID=A0A804UME9_MAIZE